MKLTSTLAVSAFALAVGIASPVMAQQTSTTNSGPVTGANGAGSDTTTTNASLDIAVQDSLNDSSSTTDSYNDSSNNSVNDSGNLTVSDSGNDNSNNSTNGSYNTDNSINDSGNLNVADSGNDNSTNDSYNDNSTNDSGNLTVSDSGNDNSDNSDNSVNQSYNALDSYNTDNSTYDSHDDNSYVVADQYLDASITNESEIEFSQDGDNVSGNNSVDGSAFAAFAGILNQAWNTGVNAQAQAATNIAARGTVTFSGQ